MIYIYSMKTKSVNISFYILTGIIITVLYLFLAAKPLTKEYHFTPEWKINTTSPETENPDPEQKILHFRLGQTLGYFTENGILTLCRTFPTKASVSDSYFATYSTNAGGTKFFTSTGEQAGTIKEFGFPYFSGNQIFVFLPGGNSFAACSSDGSTKWVYEGTTPLTAFNSKEKFTAAGFADGTIKIFDNETGNDEMSFAPGGSDSSVIFGADISPDGQYIACISGQKQQRFALFHREENHSKCIFHNFLTNEVNYQTIVHFTKDGKRILYNSKDSLGIYDLNKKQNTFIPLESRIISVKETSDLVFLLGKNADIYTVYVIEKTNTLEGKFSFKAETAFINTTEDSLFIGKDSTISKISLTRN